MIFSPIVRKPDELVGRGQVGRRVDVGGRVVLVVDVVVVVDVLFFSNLIFVEEGQLFKCVEVFVWQQVVKVLLNQRMFSKLVRVSN